MMKRMQSEIPLESSRRDLEVQVEDIIDTYLDDLGVPYNHETVNVAKDIVDLFIPREKTKEDKPTNIEDKPKNISWSNLDYLLLDKDNNVINYGPTRAYVESIAISVGIYSPLIIHASQYEKYLCWENNK
jgi:hypothetical protein